MIRRITLINFMSHKRTVIEPAKGLTVLAGQNNCGKSAVVSALQILSGNSSGDFMVRHGENECAIELETDEGHVIEWRKKGGTVSYRLNAREVHRLRGGVPDELHELLRLPSVEAEGGDFDIHFAEQKKPIFLLNETASRRATFFASSSDALKLIEMQNAHRRKIQDAKARERDLITRDEKLTNRLAGLLPLADVEDTLNKLEGDHQTLIDDALSISNLRKTIGNVRGAARTFEVWSETTETLSALVCAPEPESTEPLARMIIGIQTTNTQLACWSDSSVALLSVHSPPAMPDVVPLREVIGQMEVARGRIAHSGSLRSFCEQLREVPVLSDSTSLREVIRVWGSVDDRLQKLSTEGGVLTGLSNPPAIARTEQMNASARSLTIAVRQRAENIAMAASLQACKTPPALADVPTIRGQLDDLRAARDRAAGARERHKSLGNIDEPPRLPDVEGLRGAIANVADGQRNVIEHEMEYQQMRESVADAEHDLLHCADDIGTCPVCGQHFDPDRLLERSAAPQKG